MAAWLGRSLPRYCSARPRTKTAANCIRAPHTVVLDALKRRRLVLSDCSESVSPKAIVRSRHRSCSVAIVVDALSNTCCGTGRMKDPRRSAARGRLEPTQASTPPCSVASRGPTVGAGLFRLLATPRATAAVVPTARAASAARAATAPAAAAAP